MYGEGIDIEMAFVVPCLYYLDIPRAHAITILNEQEE
jgi:hypothetical protein